MIPSGLNEVFHIEPFNDRAAVWNQIIGSKKKRATVASKDSRLSVPVPIVLRVTVDTATADH